MSRDRLSATFSALADPTRRAILARLSSGETTVTELAAPFEMTLPAVSRHLKVLEEVADWTEHYRSSWEESFDRLDEYLIEMQKGEKKNARRKR